VIPWPLCPNLLDKARELLEDGFVDSTGEVLSIQRFQKDEYSFGSIF
jgi:hypothetical protein